MLAPPIELSLKSIIILLVSDETKSDRRREEVIAMVVKLKCVQGCYTMLTARLAMRTITTIILPFKFELRIWCQNNP